MTASAWPPCPVCGALLYLFWPIIVPLFLFWVLAEWAANLASRVTRR